MHITFEDFCKHISFKGADNISSIAADIIKTITGGVFDLALFERELSQYRNPDEAAFTKILQYPKNLKSYLAKPSAIED